MDNDKLAIRGHVIDEAPDEREIEIESLREENKRLRTDLAVARRDTATARAEFGRALGALQKQLSPLYRALQAVFGELEAAGISAVDGAADFSPDSDPRVAAIWAEWKKRLGPTCAAIIDALQLHRDMNQTQLAIAVHRDKRTIRDGIYKLNQAGLIDKANGRYSLKTL